MGSDYNLFDNDIFKKNIYGKDKLESIIIEDTIQKPTHSLFGQYERLQELALEEDDFGVVLDAFGSLLKYQIFGLQPAIDALRKAHATYVDTQKQLALLFGGQGDFDSAEEHLRNAYVNCNLQLDAFEKVTLECLLEEGEAQEIIGHAIDNTEPTYFLGRVQTASEHGDIDGIEKYIALSIRCLEGRGMIINPFPEMTFDGRVTFSDKLSDKQKKYLQTQKELQALHKQAYTIAARKKVEEALGNAVFPSSCGVASYERRIHELRGETKDLLLESVRKFIPEETQEDAITCAISFFNQTLNPLYDILLSCVADEYHPLRELFEPIEKDGTIVGSKRIAVDDTTLVPLRNYDVVGVPVTAHPFYNLVAESSARN